MQQSLATATTADSLRAAQSGLTIVTGLFVLAASTLVAAVLKIIHAFSIHRDETRSILKTPVAVTGIALLLLYFGAFSFFLKLF